VRLRRPKLANAELKVLEALWSFGPQTIRDLVTRLYPGGATSNYATVQKLLERLEAKLFVLRDRSALAHVFRAAVSRESCLDAQLQEMADKLCEGSLTALLLHLAERVSLTKRQRDELQAMLEAARKKSGHQKDSPRG
jgi:BlaI family transcriptional regulator, penicillinase repressor